MRVFTLLFTALLIAVACMTAWFIYGTGLPAMFNSGSDAQVTKSLKPERRRSAPYVILVPAETSDEQSSSPAQPPEKPAPRSASLTKSLAQPAPVQKKPSTASPPPARPSAKPPPEPAPIAKQTLEAILGPKDQTEPAVSKPAAPDKKPESQPAEQVKAEPALIPVVPASLPPSAPEPSTPPIPPRPPRPSVEVNKPRQKPLQLTYEAETNRQAVASAKQELFSAQENVRFRRVIPEGTGRLKADDKIIILAGIEALAAGSKCKYASGKSWECARWGKYALRRFIRGRAVVCDLIEEISATEVAGRCKVGNADIGQWVVRRGWGKPTADSAGLYADALSAAKKAKLGLWSEEPKSTP